MLRHAALLPVPGTQIQAVDMATGSLLLDSLRRPCILYRSINRTYNLQYFGACGAAPTLAPAVPARICSATGGGGGDGGGGGGGSIPSPGQPLRKVCARYTYQQQIDNIRSAFTLCTYFCTYLQDTCCHFTTYQRVIATFQFVHVGCICCHPACRCLWFQASQCLMALGALRL
jgi:hypothetical protein